VSSWVYIHAEPLSSALGSASSWLGRCEKAAPRSDERGFNEPADAMRPG
jgi:hypothetical protein